MNTDELNTIQDCILIRDNAKKVIRPIGLNQDWKAFSKFVKPLYPDFPNLSFGSRIILFKKVDAAIANDKFEYLVQIHLALAFTAYKFGHYFLFTKHQLNQVEAHYANFAWWALIYNDYCEKTGLGKVVNIK